MSKPFEEAKSNWSVALAILSAGIVGMGIWYGVYRYSLTQTEIPKLIEAVGTAGLSLAFGGVLGGVIKVLFDAWNDRRAARASEVAFYDQLLMDFKSVYHTVEQARFLIAAHQSAKTYGEQMRNIPDAIIVLHNVRRATRQGFPDLYKDLEGPIRFCIAFLKRLMDEYLVEYLAISRLQSQDEANNKYRRESIAGGLVESQLNPISKEAWKEILKLDELDVLLTATQTKDLEPTAARAAFAPYNRAFVRYIDIASYCLTLRLPGGEKARDAKWEKRRKACIRMVQTAEKPETG
ncbi:MAG: hypothetical protein AAFP87_02525 [Pseudomonadota bacterium]